MLNIYRGGELTDREKFIFDHIKGKTLLLVPDQFSLQAERDAFFYLKEKSLMDLRVVDFSSLGHKAVQQTDGKRPELIDKYGRHMLLTKVISRCDDQLKLYRGKGRKNSFVDMINGAISEMKRYDVTPEDLQGALENLEEDSYLKYKLEDILKIYKLYQEQIEGKYLDSEDYIAFYGDRILEAPMVRESEIWIYGFDTFTPRNILVIERLMAASRGVNVVMTYEKGNDVFRLTEHVIRQLVDAAERTGVSVQVADMDGDRRRTVWDRLSPGNRKCAEDKAAPGERDNGNTDGCLLRDSADISPLTLTEASNMYSEADRAAAFILTLVREKGYKFGDIVVVCNDTDTRGGILRRTFMRWGIPVFMDRKRKVLHHQAVNFLLALMEVTAKGYRDEALMRIVKSEVTGFDGDEKELLENYVRQYRIRGSMWKTPFVKGVDSCGAEHLNKLNELREILVNMVEQARSRIGVHNTVEEKIRGLFDFLEKDMDMMARLKDMSEAQEEAGFHENAAETAQSWNVICEMLDQILEISGDERASNEELLRLLTAGLEEVEIGLVPVSPDCVIIGTLQRTRISRLKALLVVGANEGVLPMGKDDEGLLSEREKELLREMDLEVSKGDEVVRQEEQLAIYRTFCLPEEYLYVSCCKVDENGEECRPSEVFTSLREKFVENTESVSLFGDLEDSDNFMDMITSKKGTLQYMTDALRKYRDDGLLDDRWLQVMNWYEEKDLDDLRRVRSGMDFNNRVKALGDSFADSLYRGDREALEVSASRLEQYSKCPFSHFVMYGLRAEEPRVYQVGAREIGDVYHRCLMRFSQMLTPEQKDGISVDDADSLWMTIGKEECRQKVKAIIEEDAGLYREGLLSSGREERYRTERIIEICERIAWAMVQQVRKGQIREMRFEYPFGKSGPLPPVKVELNGKKVYIQGKIDRCDVLEGDSIRIIDYKTGADTINPEYFRKGYKLQLMVYLKAALDAAPLQNQEPAGVFYFKIKDVDMDADMSSAPANADEMEARMADAYRLEGILLNDEKLISAMDGEIDGASHVIPVKVSGKDGSYRPSAGGYLMSKEEFGQLYQQVEEQVERICGEICSGSIDIRPKREKEKDMEGNYKTACKYCGYRSICIFDTSFQGCGYEQV